MLDELSAGSACVVWPSCRVKGGVDTWVGTACKSAQAEGLMVSASAFRLRAAAHAVKRCSLRGRLVHLLVLQRSASK